VSDQQTRVTAGSAGLALEIVDGPEAGRRFPLHGTLEIGRDPTAGVLLADDLVSRRHAQVVEESGYAVVSDLGSRNGTFVNGQELHGPARLDPGDHLLLGVTLFELRSARQIASQPSAVIPRPAPLAAAERPASFVKPQVFKTPEAKEIEALLDIRVKRKARLAPVAVFVVVAFAVMLYLALR
jgi:pSer/pThr/pTyr-binding forkhead associated (FHA) protein